MATLRRRESEVPENLAVYDPEHWGRGDAGVRAWKQAALDWLREDPDRRLPIGEFGDPVDVFRHAIRLMQRDLRCRHG